ncbi:MAG: 23S rRNA (guanosine(2251)-2'-O)-methyltransferase RlmB [Polaromonas sp.]|jgi:23S rRNA (guanosine2251-2'-O)-methyltransferase|uniref:23S rRNA (guanosine(2251)-2'-O)-methyltransferase RlmB n=1 Tax=Polaromonas sp. TaxID=1869339 RepID=UPI00271F419D|nr:23S rRNA (guanosine(2251)-2'-O)-methyltransferase RlmB [Polaromonas sp.]MDO9190257.1 23S rRNA (guanosine(2251)-2'-O)-methyltransferase RlmB [Sulfurimicrobium sp.]MDO9114432.1 23S rRNA (guanosine(2251)-2'-O)-methyltransferase RlmB [Polaromonas sp.]MDP1705470.1 23S rRNA (guanosine(2251)-2'-O)-methyltransferase RlmB [Sulfurimicrobium sp.]MDP2198993.1 23S rRNA (guanosine(2251)-2'-O)-methyltransferase RlmB [Sulfurimicrobium sp.]MDP2961700.1 23S rRNA (guanosine(2251)-2'-O)-methyltransferase RlmB 
MSQSLLIYGFHAVTSRLRQDAGSVHEIYIDQGRHDQRSRDLLQLAEAHGVKTLLMPRQRLDGMAGDKHQGVVAKVSAQAVLPHTLDAVLENLSESALLLVLDGVQDPHNLGACLRVADAMGAHAVIAPRDRAVGLNPTVRKVASGAAETVPFITVTNLARTLRELQELGVWVIGTAGEADQDLFSMKLDGPVAWVLGAEGEGLRRLTRENCDELARIPMYGSVESLNVSVAAGICLFESRRQRISSRT